MCIVGEGFVSAQQIRGNIKVVLTVTPGQVLHFGSIYDKRLMITAICRNKHSFVVQMGCSGGNIALSNAHMTGSV